jgi:hypothetical protein
VHPTRMAQAMAICALIAVPAAAQAQTWAVLKNAPKFAPGSEFLMTDGTVLVQDEGSNGAGAGDWWKLTPDNTGNYVNGTWTQVASMPSGYGPLYYGSAVLPNGQLIVNGGEYNGGGGVWTTKGALYDPPSNSWVSVAPPTGWTTIGDAQSIILPNGTYMLANCCNKDEATLDLKTMKWTTTGTGKNDINDEEGWTLLPSGQVLTVDANDTADDKYTEILTNGTWAKLGDTPVELPDLNNNSDSHELGPQVLRPDGTVWAVGALGTTAIYTIATNTWSTGPTFPKTNSGEYYDAADGPAALLPDGNVLLPVSPGVFNAPSIFFEFDGSKLISVPTPKNAPSDPSFVYRLLVLPTGQVMATDGSSDVEIYTPTGSPAQGTVPTISKIKTKLVHGQSYKIAGIGFNGVSQAVAYGDDYQAATNYPIVRITNTKTGHVFYGRTTNPSSMAVANPKKVTATLAIPSTIETGKSTLEVIANGVPSAPESVTIK